MPKTASMRIERGMPRIVLLALAAVQAACGGACGGDDAGDRDARADGASGAVGVVATDGAAITETAPAGASETNAADGGAVDASIVEAGEAGDPGVDAAQPLIEGRANLQYMLGNEVALAVGTVGPEGGTLQAPATSPLPGASVTIPAGALATPVSVTLGYRAMTVANQPLIRSALVMTFTLAPAVPLRLPATLALPFTPEADLMPVPTYLDESGRFWPVAIERLDTGLGQLAFSTRHNSPFPIFFFSWHADPQFKVDTGFRPNPDGFRIGNEGCRYSAGCCAGMCDFSAWYFVRHGGGLYNQFLDRLDEGTSQNVIACRSQVQWEARTTQKLIIDTSEFVRMTQIWLWLTGVPVVLNTKQHHAMLVYAAEPTGLWIYDPNYPGTEVKLTPTPDGGFQASAGVNSYVDETWNIIALAMSHHPDELENTVSDANQKFHGHAEAAFFNGDKELTSPITLPSGSPKSLSLGGEISNGNVILVDARFTPPATNTDIVTTSGQSYSVQLPLQEGENLIPIRARYWNGNWESLKLDDAYLTPLDFAAPATSTTLTVNWCPEGKTWNGTSCSLVECSKGTFSGDLQIGLPEELAAARGYTSVTGNLQIQYLDELGLPCLETVGGKLTLVGFTVTTLAGFGNLSFAKELAILNVRGLKTLAGLGALASTEALRIYANSQLESFDGLGVKDVVGDVWLNDNDAMPTFAGLKLQSIGGGLSITGNASLTDISGLGSLTVLGGDLEVVDNPLLASLTGLGGVRRVLDLTVGNCPQLTSLTGLDVTEAAGNVWLYQCPLSSLAGLESLMSIGNHLWLTDLEQLSSLSDLYGLRTVSSVMFSNVPNLSCDARCGFLSLVEDSQGRTPSCTCDGCVCSR